jgi:hypothetical protein
MGSDSWLSWLIPILFSAPWLVAIVWVWMRSAGERAGEPVSLAETARRRLWAS